MKQTAFAKRFGPLDFDLVALSNVKVDGTLIVDPDNDILKVLKGNMGWHCDSTYMPIQAKGAVFSALVVPNSGGQTGWADMRAAYDALDDDLNVSKAWGIVFDWVRNANKALAVRLAARGLRLVVGVAQAA